MTTHSARPYQAKMIAEINDAWARAKKNVLACLPTGGGKTFIFSSIIGSEPGASVAIAHRRELVSQMSMALAREGVRHRIIGPKELARACAAEHTRELGRSYYDPNSKYAAASVQTLSGLPANDPWFQQVRLWVQDECFPAGTMVGDRPIETLRPGDAVPSFDEKTGLSVLKKVVRTYKNRSPEKMMRVTAGRHAIVCTFGHPLFTKRGWVPAARLVPNDELLHFSLHSLQGGTDLYEGAPALRFPQDRKNLLQPVLWVGLPVSKWQETRKSDGARRMLGVLGAYSLGGTPDCLVSSDGTSLLQQRMLVQIPVGEVFRNNAGHQSEALGHSLGADAPVESDALSRNAGGGQPDVKRDEILPSNPWGQWARSYKSRNDAVLDPLRDGLRDANPDPNWDEAGERLSALLQTGCWEPADEDCSGSRWRQPRQSGSESVGPKERSTLVWSRLDSIEILQCSNPLQPSECLGDGHVYNIEVEDTHTYFANGVVVHNCHHVLAENQWGRACAMFPNARGLGVTATPIRADGKGLGRHADGLFDEMIVGPTMRELINAGYLTDYRIIAPPSHFDVSKIPLSASGDFSPAALREERHRSKVTGDVVASYLRFCAGKLGVTFEVDVESATETAMGFRAAGVSAEVVSAKTPPELRSAILRRFRSREVLQLVNVDLFGEGFDLPAIEVVSMARPTESFALFAQQFGRSLRPLEGKDRATIIDHVGNVLRHRPPDARREWTLDRREKRSSAGPSDAIPLRVCTNEACNAPYERVLLVCPYCGDAPLPASRSAPEHVDGDLEELDPSVLAALRGEIERIDGPVKVLYGRHGLAAAGLVKQHRLRREAQQKLRGSMALWGGWQESQAHSPREAMRRFFHRFGTDVATAMTLGAREAEELRVRICDDLDENGVVEA